MPVVSRGGSERVNINTERSILRQFMFVLVVCVCVCVCVRVLCVCGGGMGVLLLIKRQIN